MFNFFNKESNKKIENPLIKIAALLIHVAKIDEDYSEKEKDIIKKAMINVDKFLEEKKTKSRMILQVHDELLFEMHQTEINYLGREIKKIMENAALPEIKLDIPLIVDIGEGFTWAEAH